MGKNVFGICKTCLVSPCCSMLCEAKNQGIENKFSVSLKRTKSDSSDRRPRCARGDYYDEAPLSDEDYAEFVEWNRRHYHEKGWSHLPLDNEVEHYIDCGERCHMCPGKSEENCMTTFLEAGSKHWQPCVGFCNNCILGESCTEYCENLCNICIIRERCISKGKGIRSILGETKDNE